MKLLHFPLFTDENVSPEVVAFLRSEGFDVFDVNESGWGGDPDDVQMRRAFADGRVIVSHDTDIGQLAWSGAEPVVGIVHLRPGGLPPDEHIRTLRALLFLNPELAVPFLLIARNTGSGQAILRFRQLAP